MDGENPGWWQRWRPVFIIMLAVVLFALRLTGPSDLPDYAQRKPTAYVLDAVGNRHWLIQRDLTGDIMAKPPVQTWLAGLASLVWGGVNHPTLSLPSLLAMIGTALLLLGSGDRFFGARAGFCAAGFFICCPAGLKQLTLVRTDPLFSFTIAMAAMLGYRSARRGRGWHWFWLACALATLVKGPLGVLLAGSGLLAMAWEKEALRGPHWLGMAAFAVITGGWFSLAYWRVGPELVEQMVRHELLSHAVAIGDDRIGSEFYLAGLYFLARFAPWSALTLVGIGRVFRRPSDQPVERAFERFLSCWFLAGLGIFSLGAHQRGDLIFPLIPPAALLAGREGARFCRRWSWPVVFGWAAGLWVAVGCWVWADANWRRPKRETSRRAMAVEELARAVEGRVGRRFPLTYAGDGTFLQLELGTSFTAVPVELAARVLEGKSAAYVVVDDSEFEQAAWGQNPPKLFVIGGDGGPQSGLRILSNRPVLSWEEPVAAVIGKVEIESHQIRGVQRHGELLEFWAADGTSFVWLSNWSAQPQRVSIRFRSGNRPWQEKRVIRPGEAWRADRTGLTRQRKLR